MPNNEKKKTNQFSKDLSLVLLSKNVSISEFQADYDNAKKGKKKQFKQKYKQFFDGSVRKFKSFDTFDASFRRSVNPKNFSQNKEVAELQKRFRKVAIKKERILSDTPTKPPKKHRKKEKVVKDSFYVDVKTPLNIPDQQILRILSRYKNAWNCKELEGYTKFKQAVNVLIQYINTSGVIDYMTFSSGYSIRLSLTDLFDEAYVKYNEATYEAITMTNSGQVEIEQLLSCEIKIYRVGSYL